jgi:hypothetical protein
MSEVKKVNRIDNLGGITIPACHDYPMWVKNSFSNFKLNVTRDAKTYSGKLLRDRLIDHLENYIFDNKIKITKALNSKEIHNVIKKMYLIFSDTEFMYRYQLLYRAGFLLSSVVNSSFSPEALELPDHIVKKKDAIIKKYNTSDKSTDDAIIFQKEIRELADEVQAFFIKNDIDIVNLLKGQSGAKGDASHVQSILLSIGLSIDSFGKINAVVTGSHASGEVTQTDMFQMSSGAIIALFSKSRETAKPGTLSARLSHVGASVKLSKMKDCRTEKTLKFKVDNKDILDSIVGKYYKSAFGLEQITRSSNLIGKTIDLRWEGFCIAQDGICETCYNKEYVDIFKLRPGSNIGLMASTAISASLVNLTLKKSHTGITLDKEKVNLIDEVKSFS